MASNVVVDPMSASDVAEAAAMSGSTGDEERQLREELSRAWSHAWVAREDGLGVVAFLVAWHVADEIHVLNVTTRSDRRRRGIGRTLMTTALTFGRDQRVKHIVLEVRRSNRPAIALYRTLGFFAVRVRPRYYPDDEDAIEMLLVLDHQTGEIVPHDDDVSLV